MNTSSAQAILGAVTAVVTAVVMAVAVAGFGGWPVALALLSAAATAGWAYVAFSTQSSRLRDENRLVYRPVYVRRQSVQRRVMSDD